MLSYGRNLSVIHISTFVLCCQFLACNSDSTSDDIPISDLPWPSSHSALIPCTPYSNGFHEPVLDPPTGSVHMTFSSALLPLGADERVTVEVINETTLETDEHVSGTLTIEGDENLTIVSVTDVVDGVAEAVIRLETPGNYQVTATVQSDENVVYQGSTPVVAYTTQLPIWEMEISRDDLETIKSDPYERIKVPALLTIDGVSYDTKVRLHGGASRDYPKKSFRFDLGKGLFLPDTHDHIILRAEWNDKTMLRNYLATAVFQNATWLPTSNLEMVHFRINGQFYGVMWRAERLGGDFLRLRGLNNETGIMYEADPESSECWTPGGNLTPLSPPEVYRCVYDQKKGETDYRDLIAFIEEILQLPDAPFAEAINDHLKIDEYLVYLAVMAIIQNNDHIKKNYYLYRDPLAEDDRFMVIPWDFDLSFGLNWSEENETWDETLSHDRSLIFADYRNQLIEKVLRQPKFLMRYYDIIDHIVTNTFTQTFIGDHIDNALCRATPDILADTNKRAANGEYLERVDDLRQFVDLRTAYIQSIW